MEDGQLNNLKVGFIIQARMKSERLEGKVLLPLPFGCGKPVIQWITDSLKDSKHNASIFVATSKNEENTPLELFCSNNNVTCFRGDENDVLSRFLEIVKNSDLDIVVRLTADNPIVDIDLLDKVIEFHFQNKNDYTRTVGLPIGMNFEVFNSKTLLSLEKEKLTSADKEHVTMFIKNSNSYKLGEFAILDDSLKDLRLTIDYLSDYLVISAVLNQNNCNKKGLDLIKYIYSENPWIFEGNILNYQKRQFVDISEELDYAIKFLVKNDLSNASKVLENIKKQKN